MHPVDPRALLRFLAAAAPVLLISRAALRLGFGIRPDPEHLPALWQLRDLGLLAEAPLGAAWAMHSQPPLWNMIVGAAARACGAATGMGPGTGPGTGLETGAAAACTGDSVLALNMACTLVAATTVFALCRALSPRPGLAWAAGLSFPLTAAPAMYEQFVFYTCFSAALFSLFLLGALIAARGGAAGPRSTGDGASDAGATGGWAVSLGALAALAWTWSLFHPAAVLVIALFLPRPACRPALRRVGLALAVTLAAIPSAKTLALHGLFSGGSWAGLNLAQAAPAAPPECGFLHWLDAHGQPGIAMGETFNHPALPALSRRCAADAAAEILSDPAGYLGARAARLRETLSRRPGDYFFAPANWEALPALSPDLPRGAGGPPGLVPRGAYRASLLALNLAAILFVLHRAFAAKEGAERRLFLAAAAFGLVFLSIAYGANGAEQHRMRYTIHPLLWPCWFLLAERVSAAIPRLRPPPRGGSRGAGPRRGGAPGGEKRRE